MRRDPGTAAAGGGQGHEQEPLPSACARRYRAGGRYAATIMPAPTVSFVASSMRMNEPVARLRA